MGLWEDSRGETPSTRVWQATDTLRVAGHVHADSFSCRTSSSETIWQWTDPTLCIVLHLSKTCHLKRHLVCKIHFYMVFEQMCVGNVCTQPPYNDKNPPNVFFFNPQKSEFRTSHSQIWGNVTYFCTGPYHDCWLKLQF